MMRKWTLVPLFAAMAVISWAQPPVQAPPAPIPPADGTADRPLRQRSDTEQPGTSGGRVRMPQGATDRTAPGAGPRRAADQLVRPGQHVAAPVDAESNPANKPEIPAGRRTQALEDGQTPAIRPPGTPSTTGTPSGVSGIPAHSTGIREIKTSTPASDNVANSEASTGGTPVPHVLQTPDAAKNRRTGSTDRPNDTPGSGPTPAAGEEQLQRAIRTKTGDTTPADRTKTAGTPSSMSLKTPESSPTPATESSPTPISKIEDGASPAKATPFVPTDMPAGLNRNGKTAHTPAAGSSPTPEHSPVAEKNSPTPGTETPASSTPASEIKSTPVSESKLPPAPSSVTPASAKVTPFVPTDMPEGLRGKEKPVKTPVTMAESPTPAPIAGETPASPTPPAGMPQKVTSTPTSAGATPGAVTVSPEQQTKQQERRAQQREKNGVKAVNAADADPANMNQATERLLGKNPGKKRKDPATVQLTPWVSPDAALKDGSKGPNPAALPPGATPTPTPAPQPIIIQNNNQINSDFKNTTIAPTPPPAPTPGATPVATPPGVTPIPANFQPEHNWKPYPGWHPPQGWHPPKNWTPPGGWSPPPGWQPPQEWVPRLRQWGWSYIPQRGWVVPVQWTPPPDFVVPPNWYYLPTTSYDDYGFYDPSEIVVRPGQARPDLQVNINVQQVYTPPAPPPSIVLDAPPPPPRPAPLQPPPVPQQVATVESVVQTFSRPRQPNESRYAGPVLVTGSVHFAYDQYAIQPESFQTLDAIGKALVQEMPDAIINVEGHTDADGSDEYNQTLSEQRAWSVKSYLIQKFGIDPNRLIIVGYGERAPITDNASDQGKARNRRVEFENVTDLYSAQVVETAAPDNKNY